ncbi:MAG: 2OG-Fe(II) oxygenase [Halioglobus sp.]
MAEGSSIVTDFNQHNQFVFTRKNFLSAEECQSIIDKATSQLQKSTTLGLERSGYRTSSSTWLYADSLPVIVDKIELLVDQITDLPRSHQETLQVVRYDIGEEYKTHEDFWHPNTDYYEEQMARGGQRDWSIMIYLNPVSRGGDTRFTSIDLDIKAEPGKVLAWKNTIDGELNFASSHAGMPVEEGEKWVAIKWVREKPFV